MLRCISTSTYAHRCDVLEKFSEWDYDTYTSNDRWEVVTVGVPCSAMPFINGGIKGNGTTERWDEGMYISEDYIKIKTRHALIKSQRITNVRALNGEIIWKEEEFGGEPTVFNIDGSAPVTDPFTGQALEFISIASRAEIQSG